jgi:tetratricopeptide (TPR) repeat protein
MLDTVRRPIVRLLVSALILAAAVTNPCKLPAEQQETSGRDEARRLLVEASHLIPEIPGGQQSSAGANIAGQLVRAGDLADALATVRLLAKAEDQTQATGSIAWGLAYGGDFARALALVEGTANGQNKGVQYEILAELRADQGDLKGALQIAHRISGDPGRLVDALLRVGTRVAKAGDLAGAREAIGSALRVTEEALKENVGYAAGYAQVATTQAEIGDTGDAYVTLDRLSAIADRYKGAGGNGMFLPELSCAQAEIGDLKDAQRTNDEMAAGTGTSDLALMCISKEQAKRGLMTEALETASRLSSPAFQGNALQEIGMIRGAHGAASDVLEAIEHISAPQERADAFASLALEQAENEDPAAGATLQRAWKAETEMGAGTSDNVLGTIAVTRAILADFAGAEQVVQGIVNPEARVWPLWNITSFLVAAGHLRDALTLAENEGAAYPKAYALLGTAQGILDHLEAEEKKQSSRH